MIFFPYVTYTGYPIKISQTLCSPIPLLHFIKNAQITLPLRLIVLDKNSNEKYDVINGAKKRTLLDIWTSVLEVGTPINKPLNILDNTFDIF